MKVHITNLYGQAYYSVAQLTQNQVHSFAKKLDFHELGIYFYNAYSDSPSELSRRLDGIMASISVGNTVVMQSPTWNGVEFDHAFTDKLQALSAKLITFIHDVPPLMFYPENYYLLPEYIRLYNKSHVVIVPSEKMRDKLIEEGLTVEKIIVQGMWDHPHDYWLHQPSFEKKLLFAGNTGRFPHLTGWNYSTPLELFSIEETPLTGSNVRHRGWVPDMELLLELSKGGVGLVWGTSENPEDESDYYSMNVSHKVSTYLAAGLPVVVPSYLSNAHLITEHGLGFVAHSLEEANAFVEQLTESDYQQMTQRVQGFRELIKDGYFTKKALIDAVMATFL